VPRYGILDSNMLQSPNIGPVRPQDPRVQEQGPPLSLIVKDGMFYRPDISGKAVIASQEALESGVGSLHDVQMWGQSAWKTKHGSTASVIRFGNKTREEHAELCEALATYILRKPEDNGPYLHCEALSELGDVVFSVTLLALNSSVELAPAVKKLIREYANETIYTAETGVMTPPWQATAEIIADETTPVTTAAIDQLIAECFEPELATRLYADGGQPDGPGPFVIFKQADRLTDHLDEAIAAAENQYGYGMELDAAGATQVTAEAYQAYADRIGHLAAKVYLEAAYIAHHGLGSSLTDTLQHTVSKISKRIMTNRVDKADGSRGSY
jgi:hypothetical protein